MRVSAWLLILASAFWLLFGLPFPYSFINPQYYDYKSKIIQFGHTLKLDFMPLNEGQWQTACLFGGYTKPSKVMSTYGNMTNFDQVYQPIKAAALLRLAEVEEGETLIAYVDLDNIVHFIHFDTTPNLSLLEHTKICTSRDAPAIDFPKG